MKGQSTLRDLEHRWVGAGGGQRAGGSEGSFERRRRWGEPSQHAPRTLALLPPRARETTEKDGGVVGVLTGDAARIRAGTSRRRVCQELGKHKQAAVGHVCWSLAWAGQDLPLIGGGGFNRGVVFLLRKRKARLVQ
jgi:hypothetical protein